VVKRSNQDHYDQRHILNISSITFHQQKRIFSIFVFENRCFSKTTRHVLFSVYSVAYTNPIVLMQAYSIARLPKICCR